MHTDGSKAPTHTPISPISVLKSVLRSAYSTAELADCSTDSVIIGQLSISNMFDTCWCTQSDVCL